EFQENLEGLCRLGVPREPNADAEAVGRRSVHTWTPWPRTGRWSVCTVNTTFIPHKPKLKQEITHSNPNTHTHIYTHAHVRLHALTLTYTHTHSHSQTHLLICSAGYFSGRRHPLFGPRSEEH